MSEVVLLNEGDLNRAINKMFLSFPSVTKNRAERLEVYVSALSRIPVRYVVEACEYVIKGRLNGGHFLPTAAELRSLAQELELRTIKKPSKPDPSQYVSPEERRRVVRGFQDLMADLRGGRTIDPDLATAKVFNVKLQEI